MTWWHNKNVENGGHEKRTQWMIDTYFKTTHSTCWQNGNGREAQKAGVMLQMTLPLHYLHYQPGHTLSDRVHSQPGAGLLTYLHMHANIHKQMSTTCSFHMQRYRPKTKMMKDYGRNRKHNTSNINRPDKMNLMCLNKTTRRQLHYRHTPTNFTFGRRKQQQAQWQYQWRQESKL